MTAQYRLIGPFSQIVTMRNLPLKGALKDNQLEVIPNAGVVVRGQKIVAVGDFKTLKSNSYPNKLYVELIEKPAVLLPGWIDAHTHLCYAGNRSGDYAARNAGVSYQEIAAAGGGIWSSVRHTRAATEKELVLLMQERVNKLIKQGITTVEIKSGYGLSVDEEYKMLKAIKKLKSTSPIHVIATCLAAHIIPKDFKGGEKAYLDNILKNLVPKIKKEKLCNRFDVFIEENAYSIKHSTTYLNALRKMGFDLTVHGDQFSTGGSKVAIDCGAVSVDHLEVSGPKEIKALSNSDTVAVALPGASIGIGCAYTPARKLLNGGASLAIASDWNPGSAPMGNLVTQAAILGTFEKLSTAEVLAAMTTRAAHALRVKGKGQLNIKYDADMISYPTDNYQDVLYNQGMMTPGRVWVGGEVVS